MASLFGTIGSESLSGGEENDNIFGWAKGGTSTSLSGNDTLVGNGGDDQLYGGTGDDKLYGEAGNDRLNGGAGNDRLNGGAGNDTLIGGAGNDIYFVYSTGDVVIESLNEGSDLVRSSVSYTLGNNLESLLLIGDKAINGTGNAHSNFIKGNSSNNLLNGDDGDDFLAGGSGADTLHGGDGNDSLDGEGRADILHGGNGNDDLRAEAGDIAFGDAGDDFLITNFGDDSTTLIGGTGNDTYRYNREGITGTIIEEVDGGIDNVRIFVSTNSPISYTLGDHLENLEFGTSDQSFVGIGNALDNYIIATSGANDTLEGMAGNDYLFTSNGDDIIKGGMGNDTLEGSSGNDTLTGGAGADVFELVEPDSGIDTITDFVVADDTFNVFTGDPQYYFAGGLSPGAVITLEQFRIGSAAADSSDRFIYNKNTGSLFFDEDGTGASLQVQVASLSTGLMMTNADIYIVGV